jgi:hypothetical protein
MTLKPDILVLSPFCVPDKDWGLQWIRITVERNNLVGYSRGKPLFTRGRLDGSDVGSAKLIIFYLDPSSS